MAAAPVALRAMAAALDRLKTRGPDGEGTLSIPTGAGHLILGHRRLSIIDLSDAGLQPMQSRDRRYTISFNGELYNYLELRAELQAMGRVFDTRTDTEVLLQAWAEWGQDCLPRLDGMFAMAIHDAADQSLTCVRDPFGIKPFFYAIADGKFGFASEIRALLDLQVVSPRMNRARAHAFLCWGDYDDGADTFFDGVSQLRPGELMTLDLGSGSKLAPVMRRWWQPSIVERADVGFADAVDTVRSLFLQSIKRQLRSDVPLGINLSGGVDSSAIACAVRHLEPDFPINTFSYDASSSSLSERRWAQMVIDHVGAKGHWTDDRSGDMFGELDDIIVAQGEPFGSTSIAASYRVFRLARESGVTVTLDGQGADELLAGYQGYPAAVFRSFLDRNDYVGLARMVSAWKKWPGRSWRSAALHLGDAIVPPEWRDRAFAAIGHSPTPSWLNAERMAADGVPLTAAAQLPQTEEAHGRRLAERLRSALDTSRLPALLRHGDRNSMRWSIESRVPFLSPDLARYVLTLPEHYLLSGGAETKHVFRHAMRGIMPDAILDRRDKIGFETPERDVLNRNRPKIDKWLEAARDIDFLNHEQVVAEVHNVLDGRSRFSFKAWRLINYCRWAALQGSALA